MKKPNISDIHKRLTTIQNEDRTCLENYKYSVKEQRRAERKIRHEKQKAIEEKEWREHVKKYGSSMESAFKFRYSPMIEEMSKSTNRLFDRIIKPNLKNGGTMILIGTPKR